MRNAIAIVVASLLAACVAKPEAPVPTVPTEAWVVDSLEYMRIVGIYGVDSLVPLGEVDGAARLPDGGFVVADGMASELKFFNAEGEFVRTVGGKGKGPSEFARLTSMLHCGDSLYVRDNELQKFKVFSTEGKLARSFAIPSAGANENALSSACNESGTFINYAWESTAALPAKSQPWRMAVPYWISGPTGTVQARLGNYPGRERWFIKGAGGGGGSTRLPLARQSLVAIGSTRAYIGTADSFLVNVFSLDGSPAGVVRKAVKVQATTPADLERDKLLDTVGMRAELASGRARDWATMEFPKTLPAYTALVVDSAQNLWVRALPPATGWTVDWFIFGPDGKEIAHTTLPQSFRVAEIGSDWILVVDVDPTTGLQTVKAHTLRHAPWSDSTSKLF